MVNNEKSSEMKRKQGLFNYVILTLTGSMFEGVGRGPGVGGGANLAPLPRYLII